MPALISYRNLVSVISTDPTGDGGLAINNNFKALADHLLDLEDQYFGSVTPGTAAASKAVVADSNADVSGLRNLTVTGTMTAGRMSGYSTDAFVVVTRGDTDAANGTALLAAYAKAKTLTPGGNALAYNNRAAVVIPPGGWLLASTLTLDTNYIDLLAMVPDTCWYYGPIEENTSKSTYVYCAGGGKSTIRQTAGNVRLHGFRVGNTGTTVGATCVTSDNGLLIACDNALSYYRAMDFFASNASHDTTVVGHMPVCADETNDLNGTWVDCHASQYAWRVQSNQVMYGRYYRCSCGHDGFGGDHAAVVIQAYMEDCVGDYQSFGGCSQAGCDIGEDAVLVRCAGGDKSFALGRTISGTLIDCRGALNCFAGHASNRYVGLIDSTGVLDGCIADGGESFGAGTTIYAIGALDEGAMGIQGVVRNCRCDALTGPIHLDGGMIDNCHFRQTTTGLSAVCSRTATGGRIYRSVLIGEGTTAAVSSKQVDQVAAYCNNGTDGNYTSAHPYVIDFRVPFDYATVTFSWKDGDGANTARTATLDESGNIVDVTGHMTGTVNLTTGAINITTKNAAADAGLNVYPGGAVAPNPFTVTYEVVGEAAVAGCIMNADLNANLTNSVTTPNNVADAAIT